MHIDIQTRPSEGEPEATTGSGKPTTEAARPVSVKVDRMEIQGLGPINPHTLREGFHAAWQATRRDPAAWTEADPERTVDALSEPLDLILLDRTDSRRIGRELAEHIIRSLQNKQD